MDYDTMRFHIEACEHDVALSLGARVLWCRRCTQAIAHKESGEEDGERWNLGVSGMLRCTGRRLKERGQ